jgi:hypothetical protein
MVTDTICAQHDPAQRLQQHQHGAKQQIEAKPDNLYIRAAFKYHHRC